MICRPSPTVADITIDSIVNALNQTTCVGGTGASCTGGTAYSYDDPAREGAQVMMCRPSPTGAT